MYDKMKPLYTEESDNRHYVPSQNELLKNRLDSSRGRKTVAVLNEKQ